MTAKQLVPGIEKYPALAAKLDAKLPYSTANCGGCGLTKLADDFRRRLKARLERDKLLRRP